jgi:hypothetical protein
MNNTKIRLKKFKLMTLAKNIGRRDGVKEYFKGGMVQIGSKLL